MKIADLLDAAKAKHGLETDYALGKLIGLKKVSLIYRWRSGKGKPNAEHMLRLVDMAGILGKIVVGIAMATTSAALLITSVDASAGQAKRCT